MKVITRDTNTVVPDVMENEIDNKVFIICLQPMGSHRCLKYIGHITRKIDSILRTMGGSNEGTYYDQWLDSQPTLIDMMNHIWRNLLREFDIEIYVLENKQDAEDFFGKYTINNRAISYYISMEIQSKFHLDNDEIYKITGWEFE